MFFGKLGYFFQNTETKQSESRSVMSNSLWPHGLYSSWNSPGQNTGVSSLSLLQGFFPTRDRTHISHISGGFFTSWATRETKNNQLLKIYYIKHLKNIILQTIIYKVYFSSVQFSPQSCPILCDPMDCSTPGFPIHHQFLEHTQTHVH